MPQPAVKICYLHGSRPLYTETGLAYATDGSVGLDLRATMEADEIIIPAGDRIPIPTGIAIEPLTPGIAGFVYSRSGLGAVQGLTVAQGVGIIDPDYRGEITVILLNTSFENQTVTRGERIAQLVFQPALQVELLEVGTLSPTGRGAGGFGHTGK